MYAYIYIHVNDLVVSKDMWVPPIHVNNGFAMFNQPLGDLHDYAALNFSGENMLASVRPGILEHRP